MNLRFRFRSNTGPLSGQLALSGFTGFLQEENSLSCYIPAKPQLNVITHDLQNILDNFSNEFPALKLHCKYSIVP